MERAHRAGEYPKVTKIARGLVSPVMNRYDQALLAKYFLYLGLSFIRNKQVALGESALQRAVSLQPSISIPGGEPELTQALMTRLKRRAARRRAYRSKFLGATNKSAAPKSGGGSVDVGTIISLSLAVLAVASLSVGVAAGVNAFVDIEDARRIRNNAIDKGFSQVDVVPVLQGIQDQASTHGLVANIFYGLAGAAAVGSVLVFFLMRPKKSPSKQAMLRQKHRAFVQGPAVLSTDSSSRLLTVQ
ncbi:MAG: hypothetical protein H6727_08795 [Myxococcales bacterium]|nr:hypothetical protein [Myxococcales bacterium]